MLMPDVTWLLSDPTLGSQHFTIIRKTGAWQSGRFVLDVAQNIPAIGIIQPSGSESLSMIPEGEKREGMVVIYTKTEIHLTEGSEVSDNVEWRGEMYKVLRIDRWQDYGFNIAYAQKR